MLQVPVETIAISRNDFKSVNKAIEILNSLQDSFVFSNIIDDKISKEIFKVPAIENSKIYDWVSNMKTEIKGYHPHIMVVMPNKLLGKKGSTLFGSLERVKGHPTGTVIISTNNLRAEGILTEIFLMFYLINYSIRLLARNKITHMETKYCIYDGVKSNLVEVIKYGTFCLECTNTLRAIVSSEQMNSIRNTIGAISDLCHAKDADNALEELYLKCSNDKNNQVTKSIKNNEFHNVFQKVVDYISSANSLDAMDLLSNYLLTKDHRRHNELVQLYSRYNKMRYEVRCGVISEDQKNLETNRINQAVIEIINLINREKNIH